MGSNSLKGVTAYMPKSENQKLKLLYIMKILLENTDDRHGITMSELIDGLAFYDIDAERKSIYSDFEALRSYGLDIIKEKYGNRYVYYIGTRDFELAELKLLVDSVQAARFLTERKARSLIKKLEGLTSRQEAGKLHRQVYVQGRTRAMNESIYYNVDVIHEAIGNNVRIAFKYYNWNVNKEMVLRHDGDDYIVSPWALLLDNEYYYLVGYDSKEGIVKHYRVDKMLKIRLTEDKREGRSIFERTDIASYSDKRFSMFDGDERYVKLEFDNRYVGVVIDRFGKDIAIRKSDESHFIINVNVAVSNQFFGWLLALGTGVRVIGPDDVAEKLCRELDSIRSMYI